MTQTVKKTQYTFRTAAMLLFRVLHKKYTD